MQRVAWFVVAFLLFLGVAEGTSPFEGVRADGSGGDIVSEILRECHAKAPRPPGCPLPGAL